MHCFIFALNFQCYLLKLWYLHNVMVLTKVLNSLYTTFFPSDYLTVVTQQNRVILFSDAFMKLISLAKVLVLL